MTSEDAQHILNKYFGTSSFPWVSITHKEWKETGLRTGDLDWMSKIEPLCISKGINPCKLYFTSTEVEFLTDIHGTFWIREK
jgi:hypothetical protein